MTIVQDIVEWAKSRPLWQQQILQTLAAGKPISDAEIAAVIDVLLDPTSSAPKVGSLELALPPPNEEQVCLVSLRDGKGVNALVDDQVLELSETGLNVIYGDNGSGKSGYARLIKQIVGARHPAEILPDVFEEVPDEPTAVLTYSVNGAPEDQKYPGATDLDIKKVSFYDEHCGDAYIASKSVVTYRPSALVLLDGLIQVCDQLRSAVSGRLVENQRESLDLDLPLETTAGAFLAGLTTNTTIAEIDAATEPDPDASSKRAKAATELARLETTDATKERARLEVVAASATAISEHLAELVLEIGSTSLAAADSEVGRAKQLRAAAQLAAAADFDSELPGVGGETWRHLWGVARAYSTTDAYPDHSFPHVDAEARCVLCQQTLDVDGKDRLKRFESFMRDTTERDASAAEALVGARIQRLQNLVINSAGLTAQLSRLKDVEPDLAKTANDQLLSAEQSRLATIDWLQGDASQPPALDSTAVIEQLESSASRHAAASTTVDVAGFQKALSAAQAVRREVEASITLVESRQRLQDEVRRLQQRALLQHVLTEVSTTAITGKSTQLTKLYAGDVIKNEFIRETERLRLQRVTIRDLGGSKGQLEQQPALLGAKAASVRANQVLSEGEQTAMGLAGFFTEATFDASRSALVLDDPVTSLDHVRRSNVAARLAEFAQDRQVVVFTHDVAFAGELQMHAQKIGVTMTPRSIERKGIQPGHIRTSLPWKTKDFGARLQTVDQELARLTKEREQYGQDEWDKAVGAWAGDLSELWESCVSTEILDEVFDRGSSEVRVMKFRILAAVTHEDDQDFQDGYGACSRWARRHNKSPETNYVAPEPDEMKQELDRIREWQKRVKKYRN